MPENIIAKKLNIKLDTIKQNILSIKDFVAVVGDSIEITINIEENNLPKDITGATCRFVGVKSNGEYFEQIEKINIVDAPNGIVKLYPRVDIFNVEGRNICCLLIEDGDESINLQRFVVNVVKSMATGIIVESREDIETLRELNNLLNSYRGDLNNINQSVINMKDLVTQKTNEVDIEFVELKNNIQTEINALENGINGINHVVNYQLTKRIKLNSYRILGSNYIYLSTDLINEPAKNLLNKQYLISIGGVVSPGTFNSATFLLSFNLYNDKVNPFVVNLNDRTIDGKNLSPSITYGDLSSAIDSNVTGYKLFVKSNISKDLNTDTGCYGYMTPLAI